MNIFQWRSLKTRVTLFMLAIFLASIWLLALYASWMLRQDMERLLANQQSSTVSYVAGELNRHFEERVDALEKIARSIDPSMLEHPAELQKMLESRPIFQDMFNSGVIAVSRDGTAIADVPVVVGRRGTNYASNVATQTAMTQSRSVIGRPLIGRVLQRPLFNINTPIKDARGQVIGALFGVINLAKPNFLDSIGEHTYGKSGGYLVMDPQHRLIVTATDKSRVLQPLPEPGINPMTDQRMLGFLGSAVALNSRGIEVLSSASRIALPGWLVVATLPTVEAFAPIRDMQRRIVLVSMVLTLIAGALSWWLIRRQFAPLLGAARALNAMAGTDHPPQALAITTRDEIGEMIGSFNSLLETLEHRKAALQESEYRWKFAIEGAGDGLWDWNLADNTVFRSRQWKEMLGFSEGEMGNTLDEWMQRIHPDDKADTLSAVQTCFDMEHPVFIVEHRVRCKDARYKWMLARGTVVSRGKDGKPLRMIGTQTDITERKRVEEEVSGLNRDFVSFLEHTSDFVYFKDEHSRFRFCSQALARLTGHGSWRDMIGKHDKEVVPKEFAQIYAEEELPLFHEGKALLNRIDSYLDTAGNTRWVSTNKWPLFDPQKQGAVVGLFGISRDITEDKQTSQALQVATLQAERASNAKSRFLAAASHDLRQPLAALALYVSVLKNRVTPDNSDLVARIQECCESLSELLSDLLDVSKLDAGIVTPKLSDFAVNDFLSSMVAVHSAEAALKGVRLHWRRSGAFAHTDQQLLTRIVRNLIANAIRYTNRGGVLIACRRHAGKQWIEVWDTGVGIPADKTDVIFEEFRQLENESVRRGSGLGLAIVARTADLLGLQIRLCSRLGRGSMFAIELPVGRAIVPVEPQSPQAEARHLRIALVEDDKQVLRAFVLALEAAGHEVISATSAKGLLEPLGQRSPDIVISDYRLGAGETGFNVIEALRGAFGAELPAIIITGDTDPALIRSMADRGIAVYFKPVQIELLQTFIRQATERRSS